MREKRSGRTKIEVEQEQSVESAGDPGEPEPAASSGDGDGGGGGTGSALVEPAEEAVRRLTAEQDEMKDRYLRLAADFDNFRKRVTRERRETWARAQADVVTQMLDALDDLARVTSLDAAQATVDDVLQGIQLVERKILRELEGAGLEKVGVEGEAFDPNDHEAVSTAPAPSGDQRDQVAQVFQQGYKFGGALIRPAKVQVFIDADGGDH